MHIHSSYINRKNADKSKTFGYLLLGRILIIFFSLQIFLLLQRKIPKVEITAMYYRRRRRRRRRRRKTIKMIVVLVVSLIVKRR
jgi:uncharacterized membrane protein